MIRYPLLIAFLFVCLAQQHGHAGVPHAKVDSQIPMIAGNAHAIAQDVWLDDDGDDEFSFESKQISALNRNCHFKFHLLNALVKGGYFNRTPQMGLFLKQNCVLRI